MSFLKFLLEQVSNSDRVQRAINYGGNKLDGSHDHRYNRGDDRTPGQKSGDKKRRKD